MAITTGITPRRCGVWRANAKDLSVETLLTTAKDAVNLCPEFAEIVHPLRVYWLEIGVEIERRAELVELISKK